MAFRTACLTPEQLERARVALLAASSDGLIDGLVALNRFGAAPQMPQAARDEARAIGWLDDAGRLTEVGCLASDSLREYRFWLERGRTAHGEHLHPSTSASAYVGRAVLEVGCGFGANLFSIARTAQRACGVEPSPMYRQMSRLLGERERLAPLAIVDGIGEEVPFAPATFDVVICYSSHQYMDPQLAFASMARVLRPGGQLQLMSGTLGQFVVAMRRAMRERLTVRNVQHLVEVWGNTVAYQRFGCRVRGGAPGGLSSRPIYPDAAHLRRWLEAAGLRFREDLLRPVNDDTFVFADKP